MLSPSLHVASQSDLRSTLYAMAERYSSDASCCKRIVERSILLVTDDPSWIEDVPVADILSKVLHEVAIEEVATLLVRNDFRTIGSQKSVGISAPSSMAPVDLAGRRVLVVEDEYLVAFDLMNALETAGAHVLGPVSNIDRALQVVAQSDLRLDAAVLDVKLGSQMVFPAASALAAQNIPFIFVTGYNRAFLPAIFQAVPWFAKPYDGSVLIRTLAALPPRAEIAA